MKLTALIIALAIIVYLPVSCSRTGGFPPPPPPDPCLSVNINLNGTVSNPSIAGASDGTITVSATGGSGFQYSINGSPFQAGGKFYNLSAGQYSVTGRSDMGCSGTVSFLLTNPVISCTGVNIVVNTVAGSNILCEQPSAEVSVSATGGTGPYSYSLNNGPFQTNNVFHAVPTGNCILTVKDANGCTGTTSTTVNNAVAGPLFSQVRSILISQCLYCHGNINPAGGVDYSQPCNIIAGKLRIQARAVDGTPSPMPASGLIPAAQRQKITNWINAGGRYTD